MRTVKILIVVCLLSIIGTSCEKEYQKCLIFDNSKSETNTPLNQGVEWCFKCWFSEKDYNGFKNRCLGIIHNDTLKVEQICNCE